jgi:hypothetical protein
MAKPVRNWVFRIDAHPNTGTLNSASLTICTQTYTLSADDFKKDFVMYPTNKGFNVQFTSQSTKGKSLFMIYWEGNYSKRI